MILQELRTQTRPYHDRLEAQLDIFHRCRSMAAYRRLLERFYGFYAPVEAALASGPVPTQFDLERRRKAPLLARDLRTLAAPAPPATGLPLCDALPDLGTLPAALGCLYVLEGATLGGQLIARHLAGLGLGPDTGAAFFYSYGENVGRLWRDFGEALTETVTEPPARAAAVASACATFLALERWLRPETQENAHGSR